MLRVFLSVRVPRLQQLGSLVVNRPEFEAVLESIIRYATDTSDAAVEKVAFGVLNKMVTVWSGPQGASNGTPDFASGFHEAFGHFVIEHLSRVCFEVPSKESFNSDDAQSRLVAPLTYSILTVGFG